MNRRAAIAGASLVALCIVGLWLAYRQDRGHVEGEGWSGGAEEER